MPTRANLRKECDMLFRDYIYQRDKRKCQRCGRVSSLNLAHFYSRAIKQIRFDPLNACILCVNCHINWAHREPMEFTNWWVDRIGQDNMQLLTMRKNTYKKMDYKLEKIILQERLR